MSGNFDMVNLWGFINFMVPFGIGCCTLCLSICSRETGGICAAMLFVLLGFSYFSQLLTMSVMRWRHAGRVCSGDFVDNLHIWAPKMGTEEPYLHMTGSWLFYVQATHLYAMGMAVAGISFIAGLR